MVKLEIIRSSSTREICPARRLSASIQLRWPGNIGAAMCLASVGVAPAVMAQDAINRIHARLTHCGATGIGASSAAVLSPGCGADTGISALSGHRDRVLVADAGGIGKLPQIEARASVESQAGTVKEIDAEEMERRGVKNMGDIVKEELLVSAPRVGSSGRASRSGVDRGGYTGYNIRGIEGNRIALDVDGVPLPRASGRPYAGRDGANTFGIGRDYIDPEVFRSVVINSGMSPEKLPSEGIGGGVSFRTKVPGDYLSAEKPYYGEYKVTGNTVDHSTSQALTLAGASGNVSSLLIWSRRVGHETDNMGAYTRPISYDTIGNGFGYIHYSPSWQEIRHLNSVSAPPETWQSEALLGRLEWKLHREHAFALTYDSLVRQSRIVDDSGYHEYPYEIWGSDQRGSTERKRFSLEYAWTPDGIVKALRAHVYRQRSNARDQLERKAQTFMTPSYTSRVLADSGLTTDVQGIALTGELRSGRHHLSFGVDGAQEETIRRLSAFFVDGASSEPLGNLPPPQGDTAIKRLGAYMNYELEFDVAGHRAAIIPGFRYDHWRYEFRRNDQWDIWQKTAAPFWFTADSLYDITGSAQRRRAFSPQLGMTFQVTPKLMSYIQYKRGERPPAVNEMSGTWGTGRNYLLIGNADLKNERSRMLEVGVKGTIANGVRMEVAVFRSQFDNFIDYIRFVESGFTFYVPENRDEVTLQGAELSFHFSPGMWTPSLRGWSVNVGAGMMRGTVRNKYANISDGTPQQDWAGAPPAKGLLKLAYDFPEQRAGMSLSMIAVKGKMPPKRVSYGISGYQREAMMRVPGYATFDLGGYWKLDSHAYVQWQISNLFNRKYWNYASARDLRDTQMDYRDIELRSEPGRSFFLTLGAKF